MISSNASSGCSFAPQPPAGFFNDPVTDRTLAPRVMVEWHQDDLRLVTTETVQPGDILWEEHAVLLFSKDIECPINYTNPTMPFSKGQFYFRRIMHLPRWLKSIPVTRDLIQAHPKCITLLMSYLSRVYGALRHIPATTESVLDMVNARSWLKWGPWGDYMCHQLIKKEADARSAATIAAAILQSLPESVRKSIPIMDLVRLWFLTSRVTIPVRGPDCKTDIVSNPSPLFQKRAESILDLYAVFHYLSVARRTRCSDLVNANVTLLPISKGTRLASLSTKIHRKKNQDHLDSTTSPEKSVGEASPQKTSDDGIPERLEGRDPSGSSAVIHSCEGMEAAGVAGFKGAAGVPELHVRICATTLIPKGHEVCTEMTPIDFGNILTECLNLGMREDSSTPHHSGLGKSDVFRTHTTLDTEESVLKQVRSFLRQKLSK